MLVVGLNGGTGSGKTEIAKMLRRRGAVVISGDRIGKEIVDRKPQVRNRLVKTFGKAIRNRQGKLKRKELGRIVFSSRKNQMKLNQIIHPLLLKELRARIKSFKRKNEAGRFLVVDAALITEWGLERELDVTVAVVSAKKLRIQRLQEQGLSREEAENRVARQMSDRERIRRADFVIENNGSLQKLKKRAVDLFYILKLIIILEQMEKLVRWFDRGVRKRYI